MKRELQKSVVKIATENDLLLEIQSLWQNMELDYMKNLYQSKYAHIYRLNTKIRSTMLCLSGFGLYSRWVPLFSYNFDRMMVFVFLASRSFVCQ